MNTDYKVPDLWIQNMKNGLMDRILMDINNIDRDPKTYDKSDPYFYLTNMTENTLEKIPNQILKEMKLYDNMKTIKAIISTKIPIKNIPNNSGIKNKQTNTQRLPNQLNQLNQLNPIINDMYSSSLKTLMKIGSKMGEGLTIASTPVIIAIETILAVLSLLLLGEEAVRKSWDRRNVKLYRRFYERMNILIEKIPDITPIDSLEIENKETNKKNESQDKNETKEQKKVKTRVRSLLNMTSNKGTVETVENFLSQFQLVDGESMSRQPMYNQTKPKIKESVKVQQGNDVESDMEFQYLMFPLRVEEFLRGSNVGWEAIPAVSKRKVDSSFSDVETALYETMAVARNIGKIHSSNNTKNKNEDTDVSQSLYKFFNMINPKLEEMKKLDYNYKLTLHEKGIKKPNTIWDSLYDLFEEEPNKYYLATYFLWAARNIIQNYIKWSNSEITKLEDSNVVNNNNNFNDMNHTVINSLKTNMNNIKPTDKKNANPTNQQKTYPVLSKKNNGSTDNSVNPSYPYDPYDPYHPYHPFIPTNPKIDDSDIIPILIDYDMNIEDEIDTDAYASTYDNTPVNPEKSPTKTIVPSPTENNDSTPKSSSNKSDASSSTKSDTSPEPSPIKSDVSPPKKSPIKNDTSFPTDTFVPSPEPSPTKNDASSPTDTFVPSPTKQNFYDSDIIPILIDASESENVENEMNVDSDYVEDELNVDSENVEDGKPIVSNKPGNRNMDSITNELDIIPILVAEYLKNQKELDNHFQTLNIDEPNDVKDKIDDISYDRGYDYPESDVGEKIPAKITNIKPIQTSNFGEQQNLQEAVAVNKNNYTIKNHIQKLEERTKNKKPPSMNPYSSDPYNKYSFIGNNRIVRKNNN